jgi:hypothetical protein
MIPDSTDHPVLWREIFSREYAAKIATLSLALWLHAANSMLTATTMPGAVEEIGGLNLNSFAKSNWIRPTLPQPGRFDWECANCDLTST